MGLVVLALIGGVAIYIIGKSKKSDTALSILTVTTSATSLPTQELTQEVAPTVASEIAKVYVDTVKNTTTQKREFAANTPVIYTHVNLIPNTQNVPGKVAALLTYQQTGDQLGPVGVDINKVGEQGADFTFSKPTKGWPKGKYTILIKFGDSFQEYIFTVI